MRNELLTPSQGYKPLDLSYIAGLFDGEGSVTLTRREGRDIQYVALSLSNTHREIVERIKQSLGCGSVHKQSGVNLPVYNWYVSHAAAAECIEKLLPFLIVKRKEAELALEWYKQSYEIGKTARAFFRWDKEKYKQLKQEAKDLTHVYVAKIKEARTECRV